LAILLLDQAIFCRAKQRSGQKKSRKHNEKSAFFDHSACQLTNYYIFTGPKVWAQWHESAPNISKPSMSSITSNQIIQWLFWAVFLLAGLSVNGQPPFLRKGQVFVIPQNSNTLAEFLVQPGYNSLNTISLGALPPGGFDALGYRRTDNLLYGVETASNHLFRVGQNANYQDMGPAGLDNELLYLAGDISPDGKYLVVVGSNTAGIDVQLAKIDLETAGFPTSFTPIIGAWHLSDIVFDPTNGALFGYDPSVNRVVTINLTNGNINAFQPLESGNTLYGLYFDAFGDLYGIGSTLYGLVDGYYAINKSTGKEKRLATGPSSPVVDVAFCPYSVEMKSVVDPGINLPCTEMNFTYTLVNSSEATMPGVVFRHTLPTGFHLKSVLQNSFGGTLDTLSMPGSLLMNNLTLTPGVRQLMVKMSVDDIPKGRYNSQAVLENLPQTFGAICRSDNTQEPGFEDSTAFIVNRFEEDSLKFTWLICHGESLLLETALYGNNIQWNTGSAARNLLVTKGGFYSFVAGSTCEQIAVRHEVTSASCPFTIAVSHIIEPDTSFACSDVVFRFVLNNDSGEPRKMLALVDTLPPGFSFVDILRNPFGGMLKPNLPTSVFYLEGMTLDLGKDTLEILVHAGDVPPGSYKNRAVLAGLPVLMGPIRLSDNPGTFAMDSTAFTIESTWSGTVFRSETICENTEIVLNAGLLGKNYRWDNGSTAPMLVVDAPGVYQLSLFDGCEPAQVYWNVVPGPSIEVDVPLEPLQVHQGMGVSLFPLIKNLGDSLIIQWTDPLDNSLSCDHCLSPWAVPLESTVYGIKVQNEVCFDTANITVEVDQHRRVYAPNVFSPNGDGQNDEFSLQSPDYARIIRFNIFDRWGNIVFQTTNTVLQEHPNWDGLYQSSPLSAGVYVWLATIEFVDGQQQVFSGDVTLIR
jgi:gliding motility-associated-like protein